jgi:methyl-accepting chemotaxis protein
MNERPFAVPRGITAKLALKTPTANMLAVLPLVACLCLSGITWLDGGGRNDLAQAGLIATALLIATVTGIRNARQLTAVTRRVDALAAGDVDAAVPYVTAAGAAGDLCRSVAALCRAEIKRRADQAADSTERSQADLLQAAADQHTRDFTESLAGVMKVLSVAARHMDLALQTMAGAAARAGDLAVSTTETAKASAQDLGTVATATDALTSSIAEISEAVARAAVTAEGMSTHASVTESRMAGLATAAEKVDSVARMIGAIAAQTNLLALNATIEAARAGEAGKGFAVVASEVKQLARRTADATGDIASQIAAIQAATGEAVTAVREMAAEVRQMADMAAAIAAAVNRQGEKVHEIVGSIASVSQATDGAVSAMAEAAEAAEEARFTSSEVWYAAGNVGQEAESLGLEFEHFLQDMHEDRRTKRAFQRIPCNDAPIVLRTDDGEAVDGILINISRGGVALRALDPTIMAKIPSGTRVTMVLPDALGDVAMRVVRFEEDRVGFVACQTDSASAVMDKAVSYFTTIRIAA